jgi:signal transduction histidine kinase
MKRELLVGTKQLEDVVRQIHYGHPSAPFPCGSTPFSCRVPLDLLKNALESLIGCEGHRGVSIGSRALQRSEVVVDVKDTGKGLDAETAEHMFEPFYTTKSEGTGIGLAISRSIIEAHGGKLWATKNSPRGAIFLFSLPAR